MTVTDLGHDYSRYPVSQMPRWKRAALSGPLSGPRTSLRNPSHSTTDSSSPSWSPTSPDSEREIETTDKFSSFLDDRITAPTPHPLGYSFPTRLEEKEADDDMHMPSPDDDRTYKVTLRQCLHREGLVSMFGFIVMTAGLFVIFVLVPILLFTGVAHQSRKPPPLNLDFHVNDNVYPLLQNIRTGLIDPRTPSEAFTRPSVEGGSPLKLVFSDEFSTPGRTFYPGDDPYWTAPDFWYGATQDLDWYDPDAVTTASGTLNLRLDRFASHNLTFRSGMLNSWNQLCFKGGALEVSVSLPGPPRVPGFWPGVWTMGNLGRPGYKASTDGVWPYTYSTCDVGITPNQSSPDGLSFLPGQRLPSCTCPNEDHPSPGTGRGAPEIDVLEGGVDPENRIGIVTQSYQVAPYDVWYQPNYDFFEIPNPNLTRMNAYRGGPYQQAISGVTTLNHDWYDGVQYQRYAFEYRPGTSPRSHISWFVGDEHSYRMTAQSIGPNGNIGQREISEEPMSIILNLGISDSWTWIDWPELTFPTQMRIDYVRLYQEEGTENGLTCDPPGWETTEYIAQHPLAYDNPNLTVSAHLSSHVNFDHRCKKLTVTPIALGQYVIPLA